MKVRKRPSSNPYSREQLDYLSVAQFALLHAACLLALWTKVSAFALAVCTSLYFIRLFGITAGFHRYFSHRSFKTGRGFQFVLALLGTMAYEKGPLWWASHHRNHHVNADTEKDVHSPTVHGLWWSHCGWFLLKKNNAVNEKLVLNWSTFRELRFLDRWYALPPLTLAALLFLLGWALERYAPALQTSGAQLLVWGFFINTVLVHHGTFTATSLAHRLGGRRFDTKDESRNNLPIALITLGEGWHNNHHYYPASERQGFYWWEIDVTHYVLIGLRRLGVIWDIHPPPARVYAANYLTKMKVSSTR